MLIPKRFFAADTLFKFSLLLFMNLPTGNLLHAVGKRKYSL